MPKVCNFCSNPRAVNGRTSSGGAQSEPPENPAPTLKELGISFKRSAQAQNKLKQQPKAKGTRGNFRGKPKAGSSGGSVLAPPDDTAPTLKELGISRKRSAQAQKLAEIPKERLDKHLRTLSEQDKAGAIRVKAETKLGEKLIKLPKAKGGQPFQMKSTGQKSGPVATLKEIGLNKNRSAQAQAAAKGEGDKRSVYWPFQNGTANR